MSRAEAKIGEWFLEGSPSIPPIMSVRRRGGSSPHPPLAIRQPNTEGYTMTVAESIAREAQKVERYFTEGLEATARALVAAGFDADVVDGGKAGPKIRVSYGG